MNLKNLKIEDKILKNSRRDNMSTNNWEMDCLQKTPTLQLGSAAAVFHKFSQIYSERPVEPTTEHEMPF